MMLFPVSRHELACENFAVAVTAPPSTTATSPVPFPDPSPKSHQISSWWSGYSSPIHHFPVNFCPVHFGCVAPASVTNPRLPVKPSAPHVSPSVPGSSAIRHPSPTAANPPVNSSDVKISNRLRPGHSNVSPAPPAATLDSIPIASGNSARPASSAAFSSAVAPDASTSHSTPTASPPCTRAASSLNPAKSASGTFPSTVHGVTPFVTNSANSPPPLCGPSFSTNANDPSSTTVHPSSPFPGTKYPGPPSYFMPPSPSGIALKPPRTHVASSMSITPPP